MVKKIEDLRLSEDQIVLETLKYYLEDSSRLSTTELGSCVYNGPNGEVCAFARCISPSLRKHLVEGNLLEEYLGYLMPEYSGHSYDFWTGIQVLHDFYIYKVLHKGEEIDFLYKRIKKEYVKSREYLRGYLVIKD